MPTCWSHPAPAFMYLCGTLVGTTTTWQSLARHLHRPVDSLGGLDQPNLERLGALLGEPDRKPPDHLQGLYLYRVFGVYKPIVDSRRADSNR